MERLQIYEALLTTNDDGIYTVSLVDCPAVESNFLCFNEDRKPLNFKVENEEKRLIMGVVMRADHPIYRISPNGEEYYIKFSKETIEKLAEKMLFDNTNNNINLNHNPNDYVDEVYLREIFIKSVEKGINPKGFEDIEDGSLFAIYKIHSDSVWERVKKGEFKGFSIEVLVHSEEVKMSKTEENEVELYSEILDLIKKIENKRK